MTKKPYKNAPNPDIQRLLGLFDVNYRTCHNWVLAGCPVDKSDEDIRAWVALHCKNTQYKQKPQKPKPPAKKTSPSPAAPEVALTGFGQSLARLEAEEASAYRDYMAAKTAGDEIRIKLARKSWLELSESLRKADIALEESRRTAGVQLGKDQVLALIRRFAYASRVGLTKAKQSIAPALAGESDVVEVDVLLDQVLRTTWADAIKDLLGADIPEWLKNEIHQELLKESPHA